ncbi:diaminobutyrate aminotransferase apoenzyme [Trichormus variabilis ATCC 29413]|uniref:Diaminobutyrate--2-oxoglutarate transaminase n=2 Tax=Anabaena variabilis TaxID=264691 RepID=Q3M984_TRIV2|nr:MULTISPECIES: aspartate aminotransferase family protein [Nostocaceae]ABA22452.1 diaminobutyrate aminotransferase apoenzyme [Trichormus variabilis ATCC 29413]MBC1254378.1 aspartate aminotransferase family protein [Trichormus variabilis V5]MBC1269490.1 aspartate aminotransferase family protein [Trichormus variabilis FSR]MBC1304414.1 aspartate aminotransferase family protein [Trichormus variabilis N2B]MBC1312900.1 aspartate aminotransferase family protein [Trichormus variabilis PNB]
MQLNHNGVHSEGHSFVVPQICPSQSSVGSDFPSNRVHSLPGEASSQYLERQQARESNARSYPRRIPIAISEAQGIYIKDADGNVYIDCLAGAGTLALGHNHPVAIEAMRKVLDGGLPLHTLDLTTPVKDKFVEELFASLPPEFAQNVKIQFCGPSGADAVEAAIKLVKTATGNRSVLSFHGGYHGMTHGALSLTGNLNPKQAVTGLMPDVHFLPYPYHYRCPFGLGGEAGQRTSSRYIESILDDPESGIVTPAAMILEVVQGEGGVIPAPDDWLREMRRITRDRHIPLIVDEIQTGLGRTGKLYAFEHSGIMPDVLLLSKAIGGSLPLSVVLYNKELDKWSPGAHAGTFRGNQMAMAAGTATLQYILENSLTEHAAAMGDRLLKHLHQIQGETYCIGEVRGRGLMVGVEIINPQASADRRGKYPAHPQLASRIQAECLRRGLIVELGGRFGSVVRFLPPLIVTPAQIDSICEIFASAVQAAEKQVLSVLSQVS